MAGWIKIHRDIAKHWIFQDAEKFKWWIDMLFLASYENNKILEGNRIIHLKRGQFVGSTSFFVKRWDAGKDKIRNFLNLLVSDGMILREPANNITIITICNYGSYQDVPDNLPDNLSDNHTDNLAANLPATTKEIKEVKEINITTTAHAHTYTCEEYAAKYRSEDNWSEVGILIHAKGVDDCKALFEEFVANNKHDGKTWQEYNDFKRHFRQWATQQVQRRAKAQQQSQSAPKKVITGQDIFKVYG